MSLSQSARSEPELRIADERHDIHLYPPNVELFCQGDEAFEVYSVLSGFLKLFRAESNGRRILLDLRFTGSLVGSAAAITGMPHPITAVTATSCQLRRCRSQEFLSLIARDASLSFSILETLSGDVYDHIARISEIACLPARERLEHFLWKVCERLRSTNTDQQPDSNARMQLPLKYCEIAELLSITPTYLCRLLNALEMDGVISRDKGWIIVFKPSELWHVVAL